MVGWKPDIFGSFEHVFFFLGGGGGCGKNKNLLEKIKDATFSWTFPMIFFLGGFDM